MILYDKECNLLGMSKSVLDFLGYEDLEEFTTFANDVADLFEQRSGYVYGFKNFSWINYVLHSGAPNKNAILRLKNGKELEVRIAIEEILPIDPSQGFYRVELHPAHGSHKVHLSSEPFSIDNQFEKDKIEDQSLPDSKDFLSASEGTSFLTDENYFEEPQNLQQQEPEIFNNDDTPATSSLGVSFMDASEFSISSTPTTPSDDKPLPVSFDEPFTDDSISEVDEKISFDETPHAQNDNDSIEDDIAFEIPAQNLSNEPIIESIEAISESEDAFETNSFDESENIEDYNPAQTMEALGLEPNELKLFLHEYCDNIEMVSIALEDAIRENDNEGKQALLTQLKGTAKHLRIERINSLLLKLHDSNDISLLQALQSYARKLKTLQIDN